MISIEKCPVSCATLFPSKAEAASSQTCFLDIVGCKRCGHVWNQSYNKENNTSYDDYYHSSVTKAPKAMANQKGLAVSLNDIVPLSNRCVLEIGCGDGFFLNELSDFGADTIGFEPSSTYQIAGLYPTVNVVNDFFDFSDMPDLDRKIDVVIMRHVLEHLQFPEEVLTKLNRGSFSIKPPEFLLVEVPNVYHLLSQDLYFDFYNDHIHYFSLASLTRFLRDAGWIPVNQLESDNEFLVLVCRNAFYGDANNPMNQTADYIPVDHNFALVLEQFNERFQSWQGSLINMIDELKSKGDKIAAWGAGARGVSLLTGLKGREKDLSYVVDIDAGKHGKYLPSSSLMICPVNNLDEDIVDDVLVTSYTYFDEIWKSLQVFRERGGKVIKIYPYPEIVY